jgi:acyl dehydratase
LADHAWLVLTSRVGAPIRDVVVPYVTVASADAIRHFARAYGDGNPLYSDPSYAATSARGHLVAPPLFALATGFPTWRAERDAAASVDLDHLPGVRHQTILRDRWTLCRPIVENTRLVRDRVLVDAHVVDDEAGAESPDVACDVTERTTYRSGDDVYAVHDRVRRYRTAPRPATASTRTEKATYTPEQLADIDQAYERQCPRGGIPMYAEDVSVGTRLGPMTKGPMTVTDLVEYRAGVGPGPLGGEGLRLGYLNRRARPELYAPDEAGAPDITERRHFDDKFAQSLGYPGAYDYSHTRVNWLTHLLTDWMGDGAWLREVAATTTLADNFVGDTHWLEGEVTGVSEGDEHGEARVAVWGTNQLGVRTCEGTALVLLPKRPARVVSATAIAMLGSAPLTEDALA